MLSKTTIAMILFTIIAIFLIIFFSIRAKKAIKDQNQSDLNMSVTFIAIGGLMIIITYLLMR